MRVAVREIFAHLEPDDEHYKAACDRLEYLASLMAMGDAGGPGHHPWAGEFILAGTSLSGQRIGAQIGTELAPSWPLLEGGAFGGDVDQAKVAHGNLEAWVAKNGRTW